VRAKPRAQHGEIDQLLGVALGIGADIEHHGLAMGGRPQGGDGRREIPSIKRSRTTDIAISAPVLPADTATLASPAATESMERHMLELRPRRKAWLGFSSMRMMSGAWRISECLARARWRARIGRNTASSPIAAENAHWMAPAGQWRCPPRLPQARHRPP